MPCESCNIQFTVFRRKRTCSDCKRFYCSNCLSSSKCSYSGALCSLCAIFAKRPLLRADLLQLKPKYLIFYLQSKHISTEGCVEKDELVGLVLAHIQQTDANDAQHNSGKRYENDANHFDSIRQTCQNFFTNISENISESVNAFDAKSKSHANSRSNNRHSPTSPTSNATSTPSTTTTPVFNQQPRVVTKEIPTYSTFHYRNQETPPPPPPPRQPQHSSPSDSSPRQKTSTPNQSSISDPPTTSSSSSVAKVLSASSSIDHTQDVLPTTSQASKNQQETEAALSDCDYSDDELYESFYGQASAKLRASITQERLTSRPESKRSDMGSIRDSGTVDRPEHDSSTSSFEELGAIGGISDDSKTTTDTNSNTLEQWQVIDSQRSTTNNEKTDVTNERTYAIMDNMTDLSVETNMEETSRDQIRPMAPQLMRCFARRCSDSHLRRVRPRTDDDDSTSPMPMQSLANSSVELCRHCGKHRANIKRRVDKMRRYLESSQMSEQDIKEELQAFLSYLERRTKSMDCSDSEAPPTPMSTQARIEEFEHGDNEGIHVYAGSTENLTIKDSRFMNVDDFQTIDELDSLTVKQLKELLMHNRVDYKGCCEKQELLDRVQRLWKNRKSTPAVDKLGVNELCKICMDAPIECVILECGHMATCTNCGKVLSECPICRQYIVRVVRFFRA